MLFYLLKQNFNKCLKLEILKIIWIDSEEEEKIIS